MPTIQQIKAQAGGAYDDMSDEEFARKLHRANYSDMAFEDFAQRVSLNLDTRTAYEKVAQEQTFDENLLAGIGGGMTSLYKGAKQALGFADQDEIDEHNRAMAGLRSTGGGLTGDILGQVALAAPTMFIPGANTYTGSAALGGLMGAAQPLAEDESRLMSTGIGVIGGLGGKYVGDKAGRIISGNPNAGLNQAQQRAAQRGQELGFRMTPGQKTGSEGLQKLEAFLESKPFTSRPFDEIKRHNKEVINKIAAKSIGEDSPTLDQFVLGQAKNRLGREFDDVATNVSHSLDADKMLDDLSRIETDLYGLTTYTLDKDPLVNLYLDFAAKGQATGKQLQSLSSKLGGRANNFMTTQSPLEREYGMALWGVKEKVDDLLLKTLPDDAAREAFKNTRKQYRNLSLLTSRNNVVNPSAGDVHPNALAGLLQQKDKKGFLFGGNQSDLYDAARFAQAFKPIVNDSGTGTRMGTTLENIAASVTVNPLIRMYTSPPSQGLLTLVESGVLPYEAIPAILGRAGLLGGAVGAPNFVPQ